MRISDWSSDVCSSDLLCQAAARRLKSGFLHHLARIMSDHNPGLRPWRDIARRESRQIMVGSVPVGGGAPITVQTMTNTPTSDAVATIDQIRRCEAAGADRPEERRGGKGGGRT